MRDKTLAYMAFMYPVFFVIGLAFVISRNPWFSFTNNALSDMGSIHNPVNYYFNAFIMLIAIYGFVLAYGFYRRGLSKLMPVAMVFLFLVGVFPEEYKPHAPSAMLFYILGLLDVSIMGHELAKKGHRLGKLWRVLGVGTLVFALLLTRVFKGLAIPELVGATTLFAWLLYLGYLIYR